ncbi:hypothetical protein E2C01_095815 [Portunus trituberculatus]|uniref:Uncharacterized protein n=1 Tax=Portunus trituberculatus TaxID=210409 RepID=A0A5B7K589_PORTR|nr:hypothetical protein [Portunus trituberculatus]
MGVVIVGSGGCGGACGSDERGATTVDAPPFPLRDKKGSGILPIPHWSLNRREHYPRYTRSTSYSVFALPSLRLLLAIINHHCVLPPATLPLRKLTVITSTITTAASAVTTTLNQRHIAATRN